MNINLELYNQHWRQGFRYPYPRERSVLPWVIRALERRPILEITGLRRVGKTTLMFQAINHLVDTRVNPYHILYFTFDVHQPTIEELLETYSVTTNTSYQTNAIYIFLDEIQKLPNFQNQLKVLFDLYPSIHWVISGSTSLYIKRKRQESLAGRTTSLFVGPLTFIEYLRFSGKEDLVARPLASTLNLRQEFQTYLVSQFIETIPMATLFEKRAWAQDVMSKILHVDIPAVYPVDNPLMLDKIVSFIGQNPGATINNIHLAQDIGISNQTVALYLSYLEDAFIVQRLVTYAKNIVSAQKRLKKYYLASPLFSTTVAGEIDQGRLAENYVSSMLRPAYYWRDPYGHEVDFVLTDNHGTPVPLEIKWQQNIKHEDVKNLILFSQKYRQTKGFIFSNQLKRHYMKHEAVAIEILPLYTDLTQLFRAY